MRVLEQSRGFHSPSVHIPHITLTYNWTYHEELTVMSWFLSPCCWQRNCAITFLSAPPKIYNLIWPHCLCLCPFKVRSCCYTPSSHISFLNCGFNDSPVTQIYAQRTSSVFTNAASDSVGLLVVNLAVHLADLDI